MSLPPDHLERVYAGVLGKVFGVYLGRPVEGWPRDLILSQVGNIHYYINDQAEAFANSMGYKGDYSLIIPDDDVTVTFMAPWALEEHDGRTLTAQDVGKTWLNNVIEEHTAFWWGGRGNSTEHTAYLNLKEGVPGGKSGSISQNGKIVAEQIGGEIFIDGMAMCAPGNPKLAVKLATAAASVSHDGEGLYGAVSWAAMVAEAFNSKDVDHLLDTGLKYIPKNSAIAQATADIREWAKEDKDWEKTLPRIQEKYGPEKFRGPCHVVPNHSAKVLALVYGGSTFHEALGICVTCGWDTDSNGGNMGALLGVMHGLKGFEGGPDWRGPVADRTLISSARSDYSVNNCTRIAYDLTYFGRKLANLEPLEPHHLGAHYHFSLPGGVQGFQISPNTYMPGAVTISQTERGMAPALGVHFNHYSKANPAAEILTETFMPTSTLAWGLYEQQASPLVFPGQTLSSLVYLSDSIHPSSIQISLCLKVNAANGKLTSHTSPAYTFTLGEFCLLEYTIPDIFDSYPIQSIGFLVTPISRTPITGTLFIDYLKYSGTPTTTFRRPSQALVFGGHNAETWRRAWTLSASSWPWFQQNFLISHSQGEGLLYQGCRDWKDYKLTAKNFMNCTPGGNGLVFRLQGLRRWYALVFVEPGRVAFVKAWDKKRMVMSEAKFEWGVFKKYEVCVVAKGRAFEGWINGAKVLEAEDGSLKGGAIGMIVTSGTAEVEEFKTRHLT